MTEKVKLKIISESIGEMEAEILADNPETVKAVVDALPFEGPSNVWGEEIYFDIPVETDEEQGEQLMEVGDIAYWPVGKAMCIFFGPTPVSDSEKPKAYSPVNKFARIIGDAKVFRKVRDGEVIKVEKV
jgi:hypothetical protein